MCSKKRGHLLGKADMAQDEVAVAGGHSFKNDFLNQRHSYIEWSKLILSRHSYKIGLSQANT